LVIRPAVVVLMPTILLVDDSPTIRRMIRAALATVPDLSFVEAGSGLQAIETLAVTRVHMMVLDLNMPEMHGLDVLGFVRAHDRYRDLPVVVLTTRGDDSTRDAAVRAGATAYMTKPFSPAALVAQAQALLSRADA
jgi:two-component system, chemotaxis family, chemotaxis protein CheY